MFVEQESFGKMDIKGVKRNAEKCPDIKITFKIITEF